MFCMRSVMVSADRIAVLILAAVAVIAGITFRDYGLGWDDYTHSQYGDLLLKLYGSGFADARALSFVNLYKYGGGFDMAAALAAKVLPFGLSALLFVLIAQGRAGGWKPAAQRCGQFFWTMLPALGLGYLIMGLLWPWSVLSPLNPLYAAEYFDTFFEKPWQELYEGRLINVPDMPASYLPHLFMLKLPEIMLALGLIGTAGAFAAITRRAVPISPS